MFPLDLILPFLYVSFVTSNNIGCKHSSQCYWLHTNTLNPIHWLHILYYSPSGQFYFLTCDLDNHNYKKLQNILDNLLNKFWNSIKQIIAKELSCMISLNKTPYILLFYISHSSFWEICAKIMSIWGKLSWL